MLIQLQASNRNPPSAGLTTQIRVLWTYPHQTTAPFALLFCLKGLFATRRNKYPPGTGKISRISIVTTPQSRTGKKSQPPNQLPIYPWKIRTENFQLSVCINVLSPPLHHSSPQTPLLPLPESTCNPTEAAWQVTDTCHRERKDYPEQNIQGKTNDSAGYRIKMRVGKQLN